jgi:hypothetical protein
MFTGYYCVLAWPTGSCTYLQDIYFILFSGWIMGNLKYSQDIFRFSGWHMESHTFIYRILLCFQDGLREAGALPKLSSLLSAHRMALRVGQSVTYPAIINGVISSINNLAMNQRNQKHLKVTIVTMAWSSYCKLCCFWY